MDKTETVRTDNPATPEPQAEPREWVTPSFEKVGLKDALGSPPGTFNPSDAATNSS